jgi:hypothetical protein
LHLRNTGGVIELWNERDGRSDRVDYAAKDAKSDVPMVFAYRTTP